MRSVGRGISSCWGRGRQGIAWKPRTALASSLALLSVCCTIASADSFRLHFPRFGSPWEAGRRGALKHHEPVAELSGRVRQHFAEELC